MIYRGIVKNGAVVLTDDATLPEGVAVNVELVQSPEVAGSHASPAGCKGPSAQQVLGLWNPSGGAAPTDDQCDDILADELRRKHAS
jgi:hypothetical protein